MYNDVDVQWQNLYTYEYTKCKRSFKRGRREYRRSIQKRIGMIEDKATIDAPICHPSI